MMHKFRKVPLKTTLRVVCLTVIVCAGLALIFYLTHKLWSEPKGSTKAQKQAMATLQEVVEQADQAIKTDGYIEQHIVYKQSYDVGYDGRVNTLQSAASNYYATSFDLHKFDDAKKALGTLGYTKEYGNRTDGTYLFSEVSELELGQVTRCLRKENIPKPAVIVCLTLSKETKTRDYIGGANSKSFDAGFHNSVDISKPFNLIISAQYYQ